MTGPVGATTMMEQTVEVAPLTMSQEEPTSAEEIMAVSGEALRDVEPREEAPQGCRFALPETRVSATVLGHHPSDWWLARSRRKRRGRSCRTSRRRRMKKRSFLRRKVAASISSLDPGRRRGRS
ncbi:unnamed protein product [Linum trigynum]|uniref:Uncharacterized protein n=1 Tax=Linum trigynum TaxID=586398 RepID=A0AAV2CDX6_9ROSI